MASRSTSTLTDGSEKNGVKASVFFPRQASVDVFVRDNTKRRDFTPASLSLTERRHTQDTSLGRSDGTAYMRMFTSLGVIRRQVACM